MRPHQALLQLLRDPQHTLPGNRNTELEKFRTYVGKHVYLGRTPDGVMAPYVVNVQQVSTIRDYMLREEDDQAIESVQIDIYGDTWDSNTRVVELFDHVRLAVSSYTGLIAGLMVYMVAVRRESLTVANVQSGDGWQYRYSFDLDVAYAQETAEIIGS